MDQCKLAIRSFSWVNGPEDDPEDLCLHGTVSLQLGPYSFEESCTLSAAALNLLKSLTEDKVMAPYDIQMFPCCGHFLIANGDLTEVTILGCDSGLDFSLFHQGETLRLVLPEEREVFLSLPVYRREVLAFARQVEERYKTSRPKVLPRDDFVRRGWQAFWNEFHRRYQEAAALV